MYDFHNRFQVPVLIKFVGIPTIKRKQSAKCATTTTKYYTEILKKKHSIECHWSRLLCEFCGIQSKRPNWFFWLISWSISVQDLADIQLNWFACQSFLFSWNVKSSNYTFSRDRYSGPTCSTGSLYIHAIDRRKLMDLCLHLAKNLPWMAFNSFYNLVPLSICFLPV